MNSACPRQASMVTSWSWMLGLDPTTQRRLGSLVRTWTVTGLFIGPSTRYRVYTTACPSVTVSHVAFDGNCAVAGAAVGGVDGRLAEPRLHGPVLGLLAGGQFGAVVVLERPYGRPVVPVGLGLPVECDREFLLDLEVGARELKGVVLVQAAGAGVLGPVLQPPVVAAAVGLDRSL